MNKNILCLSIGLCVCTVAHPAMAQKTGGDPITESGLTNMTVQNYEGFKRYSKRSREIAEEEGMAILGPLDSIRFNSKGIVLSQDAPVKTSRDGKQIAYLSSNKQVAMVDTELKKVTIFNDSGEIVRTGVFPKISPAGLAFSDNKLFLVESILDGNGGFTIYDFNGRVVKRVNPGDVDAYKLSNTKRYFAVTVSKDGKDCYVIVYNTDGDELWRVNITIGARVDIEFSADDRYLAVKLPTYFEVVNGKRTRKHRKVYVLNLEVKKMVAAENYEK